MCNGARRSVAGVAWHPRIVAAPCAGAVFEAPEAVALRGAASARVAVVAADVAVLRGVVAVAPDDIAAAADAVGAVLACLAAASGAAFEGVARLVWVLQSSLRSGGAFR